MFELATMLTQQALHSGASGCRERLRPYGPRHRHRPDHHRCWSGHRAYRRQCRRRHVPPAGSRRSHPDGHDHRGRSDRRCDRYRARVCPALPKLRPALSLACQSSTQSGFPRCVGGGRFEVSYVGPLENGPVWYEHAFVVPVSPGPFGVGCDSHFVTCDHGRRGQCGRVRRS